VAIVGGPIVTTPIATPEPHLKLGELTERADLIATGTVAATRESGRGTFQSPAGQLHTTEFTAELSFDHLLKGSASGSPVEFRYFEVDPPEGMTMPFGLPYRGAYRVFFLRRADGGYAPVSPFQISLPAAPVVDPSDSSTIDRVSRVIGAVLNTPGVVLETKRDAMEALSFANSANATSALRGVLDGADRDARCLSASYLLRRGDGAAFPVTEDALGHPEGFPTSCIAQLRAFTAMELKSESAIPFLKRLLTSPQVETRRAVTEALWHTNSPRAIPPLALALNDADERVLFIATAGLAGITGDHGHRTTVDGFAANGARVVAYWKQWARERGMIK
jgi:hypothetical protein